MRKFEAIEVGPRSSVKVDLVATVKEHNDDED